ncbi:MAG: serine hydrolase domain-containing protein [Woeseiaceae bacterium]
MRARFTTMLLLLLMVTATADDKAESLNTLMTRYQELGQFNGVALVAESGKTLLRRGYGFSDHQDGRANEPGARFLIGSISKSFTAKLVFQFADEGKLDLSKTIADYLPYYRRDTGSQITLKQLLNHTDGLSNYTNNPEFWLPYDDGVPMSTQEFVQTYCSSELQFAPGSEYRYGNAGYTILGAIIEELSGKSFASVLETRILAPLRMQNSGDSRVGLPNERLALGYQIGPDGYRLAEPIHKPFIAAASIYATVDDLLTYIESIDHEALTSRVFEGAVNGPFAYGWTVSDYRPHETADSVRVLSTNGEVNGYNALLIRTIESQQTVILLNNTGETDLLSMAANVLQILNGKSAQQPTPRTRDGFYAALKEQGVDAAIRFYRMHHDDDPSDYIYFRWPLRILATQLISDGRNKDAIKILRLNLETHPDDTQSAQMLSAQAGCD